MIITIDGPVASGKSTIARLLAEKRGFFYINSGMLFRAFAYILIQKCLIPVEQLVTLTHDQIIKCLDLSKLHYQYNGKEIILYDGENITWHLKAQEIDHAASLIGTNPDVRELVLNVERNLGKKHQDIIIDGRDTGSIVFPNAELKIYLTALSEIRAQRWQTDQEKKGNKVSLQDAFNEIKRRDERDKTRLVAPLIKPKDAVIIDNSNKSIKEILNQIESIIGC